MLYNRMRSLDNQDHPLYKSASSRNRDLVTNGPPTRAGGKSCACTCPARKAAVVDIVLVLVGGRVKHMTHAMKCKQMVIAIKIEAEVNAGVEHHGATTGVHALGPRVHWRVPWRARVFPGC